MKKGPYLVGESPRLGLALGVDVRTVVWATGFRPDYSSLDAGVFDRNGELKHDRGVVDAPGPREVELRSKIPGRHDDRRGVLQMAR